MSETPVSGSGGIGSGGEGLRGRKVGKAPRYDSRYTINSARQDEPGSWIYLLVGALGNQVEVKGDDPAYRLAERSAEALAMDTFVLQKLADVPAGRVEDWVPRPADTGSGTSPSFDPRSFAQSVSMGKGTSTANQASRYILWSGGAADCLIVAARGADTSYLAHQDRGNATDEEVKAKVIPGAPRRADIAIAIAGLGAGEKKIWLASDMFKTVTKGGLDSKLISDTITELQVHAEFTIVAIYPTSCLALNAQSGEVQAGPTVNESLNETYPNEFSKNELREALTGQIPAAAEAAIVWDLGKAFITAKRVGQNQPGTVRRARIDYMGQTDSRARWTLNLRRKVGDALEYRTVPMAGGSESGTTAEVIALLLQQLQS